MNLLETWMRFGILKVLKCWKMIVNHDIYSLPQRINIFTPKVTRWIFHGIEPKFRVWILNYSLLTIVFTFAFNIVEFNSMKKSFINERELRLTRLTRCMWHSGKSHSAARNDSAVHLHSDYSNRREYLNVSQK